MGARANYVVVDGRGWRLYYSHWGAQRVDVQLAAGAAHAQAFIDQQQPCDRAAGWLDERWCEGAALVDTTRRELRFFGGFEFMHALEYRRAYFALLAQTWPGWTVRWAFDELAEFVTYVGADPRVVRVPELLPAVASAEDAVLGRAMAEDLAEGFWTLLTVRRRDGQVEAWPVDVRRFRPHPAWAGEGLLDMLPARDAASAVIAGLPPQRGIHVDVAVRRVGWWTAATAPGLVEEAPRRWPGWPGCWSR